MIYEKYENYEIARNLGTDSSIAATMVEAAKLYWSERMPLRYAKFFGGLDTETGEVHRTKKGEIFGVAPTKKDNSEVSIFRCSVEKQEGVSDDSLHLGFVTKTQSASPHEPAD